MLKISGHKIFVGLVASTLFAALPVWAADDKETAYVLDSANQGVLSDSGCVLAPTQAKTGPVEPCDKSNDSDGDGVTDDKDKCPNTPKGVKVDANGCPADTDGDGVPDYLDACPNNTKEEISKGVDAKGCPLDSDGDGVPDYRDRCPNTPADLIKTVDEFGCEPVTNTVRLELTSVFFDFNKSELKEGGKTALAELAKQIVANDAYVRDVQIVGHTDYLGTNAYNQSLSEKRAKAAASYLISQGVAANKVTAVGKGEAEAKQNASKAERAKDRKVIVDVNKTK
jgi:OOP family OmpA-OmpF porin